MSIADEIFALYDRRGAGAYFGEAVTMLEHGLQAAHFARTEGAPPALIAAALLHDVGHLIEAVPDDLADWTSDARHEESGAGWLLARFDAAVSEPVRLHVPAKRYLCAVDPGYLRELSAASVVTLGLQGGPMTPAEVAAFERERYRAEAVRLRRWDDRGKIAGFATCKIEDYRGLIEMLAAPAA